MATGKPIWEPLSPMLFRLFETVDRFSSTLISVLEPPVFCLGLIQSFFEGSMYVFVLMWTPSLNTAMRAEQPDATIPHGFIFATFMIMTMIGSSVFKLLCRACPPEDFMR